MCLNHQLKVTMMLLCLWSRFSHNYQISHWAHQLNNKGQLNCSSISWHMILRGDNYETAMVVCCDDDHLNRDCWFSLFNSTKCVVLIALHPPTFIVYGSTAIFLFLFHARPHLGEWLSVTKCIDSQLEHVAFSMLCYQRSQSPKFSFTCCFFFLWTRLSDLFFILILSVDGHLPHFLSVLRLQVRAWSLGIPLRIPSNPKPLMWKCVCVVCTGFSKTCREDWDLAGALGTWSPLHWAGASRPLLINTHTYTHT